MKKVIFIDRDGVINKDLLGYVEKWDQFEFLPGALESLKTLTDQGYAIVIISNQAGIGDGLFTLQDLADIDRKMVHAIKKYGARIAGSYYCHHSKEEGCDCRKPKTGLLEQATQHLPPYDKTKTFLIGDKMSDTEAGKNFGLRSIMVRTGYGERDQHRITDELKPEFIAHDITEAVGYVLSRE